MLDTSNSLTYELMLVSGGSLEMIKSELSPFLNIRSHVVELAKKSREGNVALVI